MTAAAGLPPGAALLMLLRLYVGLRVLRDNSAYYRSASAQHSLGRRAAAGPTAFTAIKSWFHTQPLTSAAVSTLGASLAAAYGIYVCENHRQQTVEDWFDDGAGLSLAPRGFGESLWLVIATMTTVGYGDTAPESWGGRILAMTAAVIGILLTAITISVVHNELALSYQQAYAVKGVLRDQTVEARALRRRAHRRPVRTPRPGSAVGPRSSRVAQPAHVVDAGPRIVLQVAIAVEAGERDRR